MKWVNG